MKSHSGTRFNITEFVETSTHMGVFVKESPEFVFELWEFLLTWITLIIF
jgi:hypothetical protein